MEVGWSVEGEYIQPGTTVSNINGATNRLTLSIPHTAPETTENIPLTFKTNNPGPMPATVDSVINGVNGVQAALVEGSSYYDLGHIPKQFEINDITIVYRDKAIK